MKRGIFITVEGTDGSGKTTQIKLMSEYLKEKGFQVIVTREPGGTEIGEKIRSVILDPENTRMGENTELMLYAACRAQLVSEVIKPELEKGNIIICDRFIDSSYAYQGAGRGIDLNLVTDINRVALDGITPDITFFFDISPKVALLRRVAATGADRIEKEEMDFHMRVYSGYKKLATLYPERIKSVESTRCMDEIFNELKEYLDEILE
ncbi:MAG: dTMP kinase [Clostridia bacterium]|nr:dTMP kinase [Clostridia bacterium]